MRTRRQMPCLAAGWREAKASPELSTATQRVVDGQETSARKVWRPPTFRAFHAFGPAVGLLEARILPWSSIATHSDGVGQETPIRLLVPSTSATVQARAPPAGRREAATSPRPST